MIPLTASDTYRGGLEDIPFTAAIGRQVRITEILIHRISAGKVMDGWIKFDQVALWRQLGIIQSKSEGEE